MVVPQKIKHRITIRLPAIPLPGIYPKVVKAGSRSDICTLMFVAALFMRVRKWKQPKHPPMDEWISRMWYIHTVLHYSA